MQQRFCDVVRSRARIFCEAGFIVVMVDVSGVGAGDWYHGTQAFSTERFFGIPVQSVEARERYRLYDNLHLVDRLEERLLLIPGGGHAISAIAYVERRLVRYFAEHLLPARCRPNRQVRCVAG